MSAYLFAGFFAVLSICTFSAADLTCQPNAYLWNGYCYTFNSLRYDTFELMQTKCNDAGMQVVSIHSSQENEFVRQVVFNNTHSDDIGATLIGFRSINNVVYWTDGTPVNYMNFVGEVTSSGSCTVIELNGNWTQVPCIFPASDAYMCKSAAFEITPSCPAMSTYYDVGSLFSPNYPDGYNITMECRYQLAAKNGYHIVLILAFHLGVVNVYDGWTEDETKLLNLTSVDGTSLDVAVSSANRMLIVVGDVTYRPWHANFYSTKSVATTLDSENLQMGRFTSSELQGSPLNGCLEHNLFSVGFSMVFSPNYPFGYDKDLECLYYAANATVPGDLWIVALGDTIMGDDDYLELVDVRSDTVFASSKNILRMPEELPVPFDVAIRFHSGSVYSMLDRWILKLTRGSYN